MRGRHKGTNGFNDVAPEFFRSALYLVDDIFPTVDHRDKVLEIVAPEKIAGTAVGKGGVLGGKECDRRNQIQFGMVKLLLSCRCQGFLKPSRVESKGFA